MMRRPRSCRVVFDGQSRIWSPNGVKWDASILGHNFPRLLMAGRGLPWYIPAVSGRSYTWLLNNWYNRVDSVNASQVVVSPEIEPTIYFLCGGHADYNDEANTAAQVYADAGALVNKAREEGAQYIIIGTTLPSVAFNATEMAELLLGNTMMMDDPNNYFDGHVDFRVPELTDFTNSNYFFDQVHQYGPANDIMVDLSAPVLDAAIAAVTA